MDLQPAPVTITVVLSTTQAWACAQFLKRVGLTTYLALAPHLDEAYEMLAAGEAIRAQLQRAGYAPR